LRYTFYYTNIYKSYINSPVLDAHFLSDTWVDQNVLKLNG